MNKKIIALIVVIILVVIIGCVVYFVNKNRNESENNNEKRLTGQAEENSQENIASEEENNEENTESNTVADTGTETGKTLVVYFSAQGHTKEVAQKIADNLDADIFEIVPVDEYTSDDLDWTDNNSRTSREHDDESLRNVELVSTSVVIGYPIWWGIAAWPVDTFVKANDFTGKTVIPFCTSSSSGLGQSGRLLAEEANSGNWLEGHRFRSNPSDSDIDSFTDSL